MKGDRRRVQRLARALIKMGSGELVWHWLQTQEGKINRPLSKKDANKFMLGCILAYQINADKVWSNASRLAEKELGDPDDLWAVIGRMSASKWQARRKKYRWLHRFPAAHHRVWRIGRGILAEYDGDARKIWTGQTAEEVLRRLEHIRLGEQLSRMALGALIDTGHVDGRGDVKADRHICRVLGRLIEGREFSAEEATLAARQMNPDNPWRIDAGAFLLGRTVCGAEPDCEGCDFSGDCRLAQQSLSGTAFPSPGGSATKDI